MNGNNKSLFGCILQSDLKKLASNLESLECLMRAPFPDDDDDEEDDGKAGIENERSSDMDPVSILVTAPSYESIAEAAGAAAAGKADFNFSCLSPG